MGKLDIGKYKSIAEIPDRELMESIYATQLVILRGIYFLERKMDGNKGDVEHPHTAAKEFVSKTGAFHERINDYLKED